MLTVKDGSIIANNGTVVIDDMAIIVDEDGGVLLKFGDVNTSDICQYYDIMISRYRMVDPKMAEKIILIKFDKYKGILDNNEICTIVNYGMNCHSEKFLDLFKMNKEELKIELEKLRNYGY